ncbi:MAG: O-antigen ligase family protein [Actinobacteria bacterium]|nr:O-antigen ligase family protein [Actinomycetota bacterium]
MESLARVAPPSALASSSDAAGLYGVVTGLATLVIVGALAAAQGGYFPSAWGWASLGLLVPTVFAWALGSVPALTGWRVAALLLVAALTVWTALSIAWSAVPDQSVLETERAGLYLAAAAAAVTFIRPRAVVSVVAGVFLAIAGIAAYSLCTRLFPNRLGVSDPLHVYRLADPVGYWNALALLVTFGLLLALGFTTRGTAFWIRIGAAATVPVQVATLYFTFGRSAWISLILALVATLALDPRRIQLAAALLIASPAAVVTIFFCARSHGLTHRAVPIAEAVHDGHHLALVMIVLTAVAACVEAARSAIAARVRFSTGVSTAFGIGFLVLALAAVGAGVVAAGGPVSLAHRAKSTFESKPVVAANLNKRLFSLSSNGRIHLWHAAWSQARAHLVIGDGAGTYERYWLQHRPNYLNVRDAHSLYLETLAELGLIGLGLVVATLGIFLAACVRARRSPLAPLIAGAVVAYAVHAGADWDWEVSVLAVVIIVLGVCAIAAQESPSRTTVRSSGTLIRVVATAASLILTVGAAAGLAGNHAAAASSSATAGGRFAAGLRDAQHAQRWQPWSPEPWILAGDAEVGAGDLGAARLSYAKAIEQDPRNWLAWLNAARVATGKARAHDLRVASSLNPRAVEIANFRAALKEGR